MKMAIHHWVIYCYVTITIVTTSAAPNIGTVCRSSNRMSWCQDRQLHAIPYEVANDTERLMIQNNQIINCQSLRDDLQRLTRLQLINFGSNNLSSLPKNIAPTVTTLKIDYNQVRYVGKDALIRLVNLQILDLTGNTMYDNGFSVHSFEGTQNLQKLILVDNRLKSIPEALPASLTSLNLQGNQIDHVSVSALMHLNKLKFFHLGNNRITNPNIEPKAFSSLASIAEITLSGNQLTDVPTGFPAHIPRLVMANNRIRYLYRDDGDTHGGVRRLTNLDLIDVSYNMLESVEPDALAGCTAAVQLHDNPFRCDCYMKYLKEWLENRVTPLSMEAEMRCYQPKEFRKVALNNIEQEALQCPTRTRTQQYLKVEEVLWNTVRVNWAPETADPGFVKRKLMYGIVQCPNCSTFALNPDDAAQTMMSDVNFYPLVSELPNGHINITLENLKNEQQYAICMFDTQQTSEAVPAHQCILTTTMSSNFAKGNRAGGNGDDLPVWVIITIACSFLVLLIVVIAAFYWWRRNHRGGIVGGLASRRKRTKQRDSQRYYPGTAADPYVAGQQYQVGSTGAPLPPQQPQQPAQQQVRHPAAIPPHFYDQTYDSHGSDRTYAECGSYRSSMAPPNGGAGAVPSVSAYRGSGPPRGHLVPPGATAYHQQRGHQRDSGIDARKEFDALLMTSSTPGGNKITTRHMVSPFQESLTSSDGPDTMSTYQTGTIGSRDTNVDDDNYLLPTPSPSSPHHHHVMLTSQSPSAAATVSTSTSITSGPYDHLIPHHTGTGVMMLAGGGVGGGGGGQARRDYGNLLPAIPTATNNNNEMYI